ncbi:MAG: OmpA family protein [Gammaproteobacteria bacterium]|nr:OmpA family protein [Gammaproteobacteria bacterium]
MKRFFIVSITFLHLVLSQNVFSTMREYRNSIQSANWTVKSKPQQRCELTQEILSYGQAVFSKRSGYSLVFKLKNNESVLNDMSVDVFIESLPWQYNDSSKKLGKYLINTQSKILTIDEPNSKRAFQQLELGKVIVLQYFDKEIQKDVYKYYVSPLKIRDNTEAFKQCLSTLFEYDPEFIKNFVVHFDYNKSDLKPEAKKNLSYVVDYLKVDDSLIQVRIDAHADNIGRRRFNDRLSKRRGEAVRDFLVSKGVDVEMIFIKAHGERDPQYENDTEEGRAKNRHAQIQLLTTPAPPPEVKVKVVQDPKAENFKPTDSGSTPVPSFINFEHLINRQ